MMTSAKTPPQATAQEDTTARAIRQLPLHRLLKRQLEVHAYLATSALKDQLGRFLASQVMLVQTKIWLKLI